MQHLKIPVGLNKYKIMKNINEGYGRLHVDVGANEGDCIDFARYEPDTFVLAFEPVPKLCETIRAKTTHLRNFKLVETAVSNFNGVSQLNISPESQYGDYSCSSLLEFSDKSKTDWPGREDFKFIDSVDVNVIRLDNFIIENGITKIDFLKIDTQGHDLKVLEGCGKLISIVKMGTMEAGAKNDILYNGQNTEEESIKFLQSHGFEIVSVDSNDVFRNEVNIVFRNKSPKEVNYSKIWSFA
jgi:FkbM family methyltransferase